MQIRIETVIEDRMRIDYMAGSPEQAALFLNWLGGINFPPKAPAAPISDTPSVTVEASAPPAAPEEEITLEMCSQLAVAIVNAKGRDAFNAVMSQFGVARLGELKKEQLPAVYEALKEASNG